jgi:hypothetical protein
VGYIRAGQNPEYGDTVIPVHLPRAAERARGRPVIAFFSVLSLGGDHRRRERHLSTRLPARARRPDPVFMTVIEYLGRRRELGASYLPRV